MEDGAQDCADVYLKSMRDWEDFSRLWITFKGITEMMKTAGVTAQLRMETNGRWNELAKRRWHASDQRFQGGGVGRRQQIPER